MQRLLLILVMAFLGCFSIPGNLSAQDAEEYFKRGTDWDKKGEHDKAIDAYSQALRLFDPADDAHLADAHYNRGIAYGKKGEFDKAIADNTDAIRLDPRLANAFLNRGVAFKNKGEYDKAIADYSQALLLLDPKDATEIFNAYYDRGIAWHKKGEYDKAIADYNQALAVNPKSAFAYVGRGMAWHEKGEYDKAIADYNQALAVNPDNVQAYNNLAWLYATCPDEKHRDGKKAVANANKAYDLDGGKNWHCVGTLAAAYAESGDFERAREWGAKAVEMAANDKSASDKDKAEPRFCLELYKQGKPYRDEPKKQ
jgi:tetratricopeptide (TPR) repeat protein